MATEINSFLPYHEPDIVTILILSSLLLILNVVNTILDKLIYCGLLGQVFVGVVWGTPGAKWLGQDIENVIVQLGYLGLILIVYEGGLETNFHSLKANIILSVAVATTGICFPIGLSFILRFLVNATPLQAFAAGAALCSTSLGTTFTVLSTSGLSATRLGTVLTSAAMMDDVVGLVMVQIISDLGNSADSFKAVTVIQPVAVSVGLAIGVPLACRFVAQPLTVFLKRVRASNPGGVVSMVCRRTQTVFVVHTLILVGFVTGATYAGTSNLFAAYLAGASISWWDSAAPHIEGLTTNDRYNLSSALTENPNSVPGTALMQGQERRDEVASTPKDEAARKVHPESTAHSGTAIYQRYYAPVVQRILKPFFFASIGFAIPITKMFKTDIVWRGIVYTILMLFAKMVTGVWLIRLNISWPKVTLPKSARSIITAPLSCLNLVYRKPKKGAEGVTNSAEDYAFQTQWKKSANKEEEILDPHKPQPHPPLQPTKINTPLSLYPASLLGTAMTARGEIGFLIGSLAETSGLFASSSSGKPSTVTANSEIYLVVTWAVVMCTIIGPLGVGMLVRRVRRLQGEREKDPTGGEPLGVWGVS